MSDLRAELLIRDEDTNAEFKVLDEVPNLRSAAVRTVSVLDSLLVQRDTLKSNKVIKEKQYIVCTVRSEEIDCEWSARVSNNSEALNW